METKHTVFSPFAIFMCVCVACVMHGCLAKGVCMPAEGMTKAGNIPDSSPLSLRKDLANRPISVVAMARRIPYLHRGGRNYTPQTQHLYGHLANSSLTTQPPPQPL